MSRLLSVEHLRTVFPTENGAFTAVNDVNFHLDRGETVGIVGESGSGKSVTSLSIMRLLPHPGKSDQGKIIFHHEDGTATDLLQLPGESMRSYRGNKIAMI